MTRGPQRLIDDPEFSEVFAGLAEDQGPIEGLPDAVRRDVAAMISASVAGAAGVAALGGISSSVVQSGGAVASSGAASSVASGSAAASASAASGAVASGTAAGASTAVVGAGVASSGVAATAVGGISAVGSGLGAASASLAALGMVPKAIAVVSLVSAVTAGGVVASRSVQADVPERAAVVEGALESERAKLVSPANSSQGVNPLHDDGTAKELSSTSEQAIALEEIVAAEDEDVDAEDRTNARLEERQDVRAGASRPQKRSAGLAGEVKLLQQARAAMSTNPERAWVFLNAYHRTYPQGALRSEYETLIKRAQSTNSAVPEESRVVAP